jgi:hypothetical protein
VVTDVFIAFFVLSGHISSVLELTQRSVVISYVISVLVKFHFRDYVNTEDQYGL